MGTWHSPILAAIPTVFLGLLNAHGGAAATPLDTSPPLELEATIPLTGVSGRIDHLTIDAKRRRLFVAELGNNSVDVIDLDKGRTVGRITGLHEPQGVGVSGDMLAVANGGDGIVSLYRSDDLSPLGSIPLGNDADDVRVDQATGRIFVGFGQGAIAVIDPAARAKIGEIKLPAHPEGFQFTPGGDRGYVNVPAANQIAVISGGRQISSWRSPESRSNFPLALDDDGGTAAVVFRNPPYLALFDTRSGVLRARVATCADADDAYFDGRRTQIYVSCGSGVVDVFDERETSPRRIAEIKTAQGARTSLFVPELDRLFVAARSGRLNGAKILVYRPQDRAPPKAE
ncbi:NHL repeat containing protein [Hyphomicrobium denitrificans 1NES1]|uniref:NHL repeat containing protein n=1 Tax=Hyphomicrobium denitrificans 1NES1 TaxID=670307 RepID=N0B7V2_9HYPH|nr:YncE family protein [Hyphomicrobium denitrificans]AGK58337.1 NHL repeat containing protein [Hyphomicrobium denitrificans 1NES1]